MGSNPQDSQQDTDKATPSQESAKAGTLLDCLELFWSFFRAGLFTLGGGHAMLPMLRAEVVLKYHSLKDEEMLNVYAINQTLPGTIAVNTATIPDFNSHPVVRNAMKGFRATTLGLIAAATLFILSQAITPATPNNATKISTGTASQTDSTISGFLHSINITSIIVFAILPAAYWKLRWHPVIFILTGDFS